jgi:hypothetical protein
MRHDAVNEVELARLALNADDSDSVDDEDRHTLDDTPSLASHHYTRKSAHGRVIKVAKDLVEYVGVDCFYNELRRYFDVHNVEIHSSAMAECPVKVYHQLRVRLAALGTGVPVEQRIRCTINKRWKNADKRRDWVFWKPQGSSLYGALHGELPARLRALFTIEVFSRVHQLAFVEATMPINGGRPDEDSGLVRVERSKRRNGYLVVGVENISCAAQLIPDAPLLSAEDQVTWVVNSHVDLETWNKVYEYDDNT